MAEYFLANIKGQKVQCRYVTYTWSTNVYLNIFLGFFVKCSDDNPKKNTSRCESDHKLRILADTDPENWLLFWVIINLKIAKSLRDF